MADDTRDRYINPYEAGKKVFWDNYSVIKTAEREVEVKGTQKEKTETTNRMKAKGFSMENIAERV